MFTETESGHLADPDDRELSIDEELEKAVQASVSSGDTMIAAAVSTATEGDKLRLVKLSGREALFEFATSRLEDPNFRCAMPRQCLRCGTRSHLRAHVIVYAPEMVDSLSLEQEHLAGAMTLSDKEVRGLTGEQVLSRLPKVPNVPSPGDLPMPYWVCDMCTGAGLLFGQINVNRETKKGYCRLRIHSLRVAEEFMVAAGAGGTPSHEALKEKLDAQRQYPWDNLSETVQHRLKQWYKPTGDERFVAYVPDRDRARTEDGMAGILLSTHRMIYHQAYRHEECEIDQSIELALAMAGPKGDLTIKTPHWNVKRMRLDRDGTKTLRRGLYLCRAKANWQ